MNSLRLIIHGSIIRPILKLVFRFKPVNVEAIRDVSNLVLTPNHSSHFDLLTILSSLPLNRLKSTYAVAAEDYFFNTPMKAFLVRLLFNAIPFDRKVRIEKSFLICEAILKSGGSLVIFPEGTRSVDGTLTRFKPGVGRLLASRGSKAVPAYIAGAYQAYPKGAFLPHPTKISVTFGEPQNFKNIKADTNGYLLIASALQKSLESLRDAKSI